MQMRDKYDLNALHFNTILAQLHLCSFSAIQQEIMVTNGNNLGCGTETLSWRRCSTAQYGNVKIQLVLNYNSLG